MHHRIELPFLLLVLCLRLFVSEPIAFAAKKNAQAVTVKCSPTALLTKSRPTELKNVIIVAGYSSGADLGPELAKLGFKNILHIHPDKDIPAAFVPSFQDSRAAYSEDHVFTGDVDALIARLTASGTRTIDAVFAGTETGVALANQLSHRLGLKGNDPSMSDFYRVKSLMQQRIDAHGLSSILGLKTHSLKEAAAWIKTRNKGSYPVVVKPVDGAGTQGFHLCFSEAEVRAAFEKLLGAKTVLNGAINDVLVQRYINAEEYVVNTVSLDGKHVVTEIWHYNKRKIERPGGGHSKIYDFDELVPFDSAEAAALIPYTLKALDALGVVHGPGHMEIMLPADGPVMMELGTRLMGGHAFAATRLALGTSALDLMIAAALFPEKFADAAASPIAIKKHVRQVQFITRQHGTITRVNFSKDEIARQLPSFAGMSAADVGDSISPTVDLVTSPGSLWLIAESPEQLERDYRKFRDEIEPRLYDVAQTE